MSQVSKYLLNKDVEEQMFDVFWKTIARLITRNAVKKFFFDLLSPTEKTMLAKRLAIAIMLIKGYDYRTISQTLKVSTTTIMSISNWLKNGGDGYKMVIQKIIKEEKTAEFWDNLEEKLSNLLPPGPGTDWKRVKSQEWQERISRRRKRALL